MSLFKCKEHLPRIAYYEKHNGVKVYYIEIWGSDETGSYYMRDSSDTMSESLVKKWLKCKTDEEVVRWGIL